MYDNKFICLNCQAYLEDGDKYCRNCGTKKGEGHYSPTREMTPCIYGPPPIKRVYKCNACGHKWDEYDMIPRRRYCPKCGKGCDYIKEDDPFDNEWM